MCMLDAGYCRLLLLEMVIVEVASHTGVAWQSGIVAFSCLVF